MTIGVPRYIHGYSEDEALRLDDQAATLADLLHHDTRYAPGSLVLEVGCGTGAQTRRLTERSPKISLVSVDLSATSLLAARARGVATDLVQGEIMALPFRDGTFDHIFVCFVLEHLADPTSALQALRRLLRPDGTITVIEGDHGSCYYHPATLPAASAWGALIAAQRAMGGDPLIGRRLYPLVAGAGFAGVTVSLRQVYADESRPDVQDGFVQRTIVPMVEGVRERNRSLGVVDPATFEQGLADLRATGKPGGTFCYTFFKASGVRPKESPHPPACTGVQPGTGGAPRRRSPP
jgi:SAM-dependent methyltransferase